MTMKTSHSHGGIPQARWMVLKVYDRKSAIEMDAFGDILILGNLGVVEIPQIYLLKHQSSNFFGEYGGGLTNIWRN